MLYTNWAELPPYVSTSSNGYSPAGIIGNLVEQMILSSCGICKNGHGLTSLNYLDNGKGRPAIKRTMNSVRQDVDEQTQISFPVIGLTDDDKFQKDHVFVPMVESPGIAFIAVSEKVDNTKRLFSDLSQYLPFYLFSLMMAYVAGIFVWLLVSNIHQSTNFICV